MNLAVRLYGDLSNDKKPAGMPDEWPCEVRELSDGTELPNSGNWQLMSREEYDAYRAAHIDAYDAWETAKEDAENAAKAIRDNVKNKIKYGNKIIEDFRIHTYNLGNGAESLLEAFSPVAQKLQLGFLSGAATTLDAINGIDLLNDPYDQADPNGPTLREAFSASIRAGDI